MAGRRRRYCSLTQRLNRHKTLSKFAELGGQTRMLTRRSLCYYLSLAVLFAALGATLPTSSADTFRPVVRGRRGVVAGGQPLSVEAGMRILQHGGNAVDAGVATILAASVIEFS